MAEVDNCAGIKCTVPMNARRRKPLCPPVKKLRLTNYRKRRLPSESDPY